MAGEDMTAAKATAETEVSRPNPTTTKREPSVGVSTTVSLPVTTTQDSQNDSNAMNTANNNDSDNNNDNNTAASASLFHDARGAVAHPPSATETPAYTIASITDKDVLMGRGKRASQWPGNVHFRTIVRRLRPHYCSAARAKKGTVARQVIAEIQQHGGRFVQQVSGASDPYTIVSTDRALEKASQALRERTEEPPKKKQKTNKTTVETPFEPSVQNTPPQIDEETPHPDELFAPSKMIQQLTTFKHQYGHAAVPPGWSSDVVLADWCTVQRQIRREVVAGLRQPPVVVVGSSVSPSSNGLSQEQHDILEALSRLGFCWDYEDWHWEHMLECYSKRNEDVQQWVVQQQEQYRRGELSQTRKSKLEAAGILLAGPVVSHSPCELFL